VATLAALLRGRKHVVVGSNLPIPAAASLLARQRSATMRIEILGSARNNALVGLADLYDFACQGRFDGFFLSPGQVDGAANVNLVGVGPYPRLDVRWSGSHGSPLLYMMIPNVILFRTEHSRRVLVPAVDFVSAAGVSARNVFRPGGPIGLVTGFASFSFDPHAGRFTLQTVHPGHTEAEIEQHTGFSFDRAPLVATTPLPDVATCDDIAGAVSDELAEVYPRFAERLRASAATLRASLLRAQEQVSGAKS